MVCRQTSRPSNHFISFGNKLIVRPATGTFFFPISLVQAFDIVIAVRLQDALHK